MIYLSKLRKFWKSIMDANNRKLTDDRINKQLEIMENKIINIEKQLEEIKIKIENLADILKNNYLF